MAGKKVAGKKVSKRAKAATGDLTEPMLFTYIGDRSAGQHLLGVPMRDLTLVDYDGLEPRFQQDVMGSSFYHRTGELAAVRKLSAARAKGAAALHQTELDKQAKLDKAKPKGVVDSDVVGRVDSDVLTGGSRVPPTDEPVGEGAPGFQPVDTSTTSAAEEG